MTQSTVISATPTNFIGIYRQRGLFPKTELQGAAVPVLLGCCTSLCILFALELHPKLVHRHVFAVRFISLGEAGFGIKLFEEDLNV